MCGVTAWSTDSSALCGGLMVCVFVWMHFFVFILMRVCARFFFPVFALLVWWFCVCLYHRCCPGRRVVFSHTPSSIKTTQAVRMNWTSSSMEESYSSLFYWTLWVKYISTQLLSCTLGHPFNWRWKLKYHRGIGQWLMQQWLHRAFLYYTTLRASFIGVNMLCWKPLLFVNMFCFEVIQKGKFSYHSKKCHPV